jgi:hypothetical protein
LSISDTAFDAWVALAMAEQGPFTAHAVLLREGANGFVPLCGTWIDIDDTAEWGAMILAFAGAGVGWDAAAFFAAGGLLDNPAARTRMQALEAALDADARLLGEAALFGPDGARVAPE